MRNATASVLLVTLVFGLCLLGRTVVSAQNQAKVTNLIGVPVIVTDANGRYVSDLQQADFEIVEDNVKQNVVSFLPASAPLSVVLLLDTSVSTQEKLGDIRRAAQTFVDQLAKADRIKVITFDDQVRELSEFTADRAVIKKAIANIQPGYSTKFYDGMNVALEALREVGGRKAIVIFSDGVDYRSDYATEEGTLRSLEQDGVVVYPIRFSTRAAAERLAREQGGAPAEREIVRSNSPSRDSVPGETPTSTPRTGPLGLPSPEEILRRRREDPRNRRPTSDTPPGEVGSDIPNGRPDPRVSSRSRERKPTDDPIKANLDRLYGTADTYLQAAADKSGGQLLRADDISTLPAAFSQIAAQLRAQYFIVYESANKARNDQFRTIKVSTARTGLTIRARAGYRQK
jgi:VWFA-related protein